jgi:hypothetical protein
MGRLDLRTRTGQISAIIQTQQGTSIDPDAQSFFDRVTAAGGALSQTEKDAVNTLTFSLKSAGVWTLMKAIYPMVGASAAACSQNLKSSSFTGAFTSGWTFTSLGVTPNGTSAYMDTQLTPSVSLSTNNTHLSFYSRTNNSASSIADIGSYSSATFYTLLEIFGSNFYALINQTTVGFNAMATSLGHYVGSRTASNVIKSYRNGVIFGNNTTASSSPSTVSITLGALNLGGSFLYYSNRQYSFASIGDSISDANTLDFYNAVQTFQTSLSRQV